MIKKEVLWLLLITAIFTGVTVGLLFGRYTDKATVTLSAYDQECAIAASTENNTKVSSDGKININTATMKDLMLLPGIGETYAQRIIEYRLKNGPFMRTEDLLNVKGIGEKRLESINALITVGG